MASGERQQQTPDGDNGGKCKRPQPPSCDACRLRKVRCDKKERLDQRAQELGTASALLPEAEVEATACSKCLTQGLRCTFEHGSRKRAKLRNGKRILAIQSSQLQQQGHPSPMNEAASTSTLKQPSTCTCSCACSCTCACTCAFAQTSHSAPAATNGLLGVEGMTRSLLEQCFKMFFRYVAPIRPILHLDHFWDAYLSYYDQQQQQQQTEQGKAEAPVAADELLLLAVAGLGAGLLEPSMASLGSEAKFKLQDRCVERYSVLFEERDWTDWHQRSNAGDVVEAMYLMTDFDEEVPQGRRDSHEATSGTRGSPKTSSSYRQMTDVPKGGQEHKAKEGPLRRGIFSHTLLVEMAMSLRVNRAPQRRTDCAEGETRPFRDADGSFITAKELFRRKRIFWVIFTHDTLRCFARRESPRIGDDDYDQDLPKLSAVDGRSKERQEQPRKVRAGKGADPLIDFSIYQTGDATDPSVNPAPANVTTQPARSVRFDGLYLEHNLRFVFLVRAVAMHFVSPRSQGKGIRVRDVDNAVSALRLWKQELPGELRWERNVRPLAAQHVTEGDARKSAPIGWELARRNAIKALSLQYLYHGTILCLWSAVKDFGLRTGQDVTEQASLLVFRMKSKPDGKEAVDEQDCADSDTGGRVDKLAKSSFDHFVQVTREAQPHGLLRCSPNAFLKTIVAFVHLGIGMAANEAEPGAVAHIAECCHSLVAALSTIDSYQNVHELREQLGLRLQHLPSTASTQDNQTGAHVPAGQEHFGEDLHLFSSDAQQAQTPNANSWLSDWLAQVLFQPMSDALLPGDDVYRQQGWQEGTSTAGLTEEQEFLGLFDPVW
ncbi:hypothetical protein FA10DRAFT_289042 [Acaromyces ingoldii]|uniref:Zn(2)-C6 fungal-type domain-containing protein n=1 Tax=Acaromyces ingoldii TaxID=215250 RepID=A0A316YGR5_9BASI|nr:hypothetical protein FA10DRAFT_289042 [Acaromyces ingoldii]PWN86935.1 hypothetical protein FA10DRAFT_289042 [Acaromyces ingoldii]